MSQVSKLVQRKESKKGSKVSQKPQEAGQNDAGATNEGEGASTPVDASETLQTHVEAFAALEGTSNAGEASNAAETLAAPPEVIEVDPAILQATLTHYIKDGFRPESGARLYAHTLAFMTLTGMLNPDAKPVPGRIIRAAMGSVAVDYHRRKERMAIVADSKDAQGNVIPGGYVLTELGRSHFTGRNARIMDMEAYSAFHAVLSTGQVDERAIKNPNGIGKF